ncbi:hypothetical protein EHI42_04640 [Rhizobium hidalgonense]|uniref:hypothetical protein n=1 Tax=Rhizobium hidalgonense TaxID=1538159 RepID=UPI000FEC7EF5|nr:hypothetical protein [Rhizobium hidalgonense]RWX19441.1 hypothetical protein EHI42_04640 [Rhizobium hidalgonense]
MLRFVGVSFMCGAVAFLVLELMRSHWGDNSMFTEPYVGVWFLLGELIGGIGVQTIFGLLIGGAVFVISRTPDKVRRSIITSTITTTIVTSLMLIGVYGHRTERTVVEALNLRGAL